MLLPEAEDCVSLQRVLACSDWDLRFTQTFEEARAALHTGSFKVVISESHLLGGYCWIDLLDELQKIPESPPLIVADRLADERLWSEVLNLGGCDLIAKPFAAKEFFTS